jgi:hypothetical protein
MQQEFKPYGFPFEADEEALAGPDFDGLPEVPIMVTKLLSRKEMLENKDALAAVRLEAAGLASKGTWDESSVREQADVIRESRESGQKIHLGELMSLCSIK